MLVVNFALALAVTVQTPLHGEIQPQSEGSQATQSKAGDAGPVTIRLKDGSRLVGRIVVEDEQVVKIVTLGGVAMDLPRGSIESIESGDRADADVRPSDSNATRLLFAPTGRPLQKGAGYFSDHYVVFPGVAYGITDNLSIGAGISVIPGISAGEQLLYAMPKFGKQFSDTVAVSAGGLFARGGHDDDDANISVGFAMATFGRPDRSLTIGAGVARTVEDDYTYELVNGRWVSGRERVATHTPIVVLGGTARLSNRISFVTENWLILDGDIDFAEQPFSVGLRFLGDRLSADVGVILVGAALDEGFPIPWLSMTYHFGKSTARTSTTQRPISRSSGTATSARPEAPAPRW